MDSRSCLSRKLGAMCSVTLSVTLLCLKATQCMFTVSALMFKVRTVSTRNMKTITYNMNHLHCDPVSIPEPLMITGALNDCLEATSTPSRDKYTSKTSCNSWSASGSRCSKWTQSKAT
ncbi:hypothetical protein M758_10G164300 [Ceratodon purpureus]|nr:hypothetical protein M758_10G164300 [Ceratodon purpureus]